MSAKGQVIKFHGTGEGFGGDDSTVVRGTATVGDVGVTGKPTWDCDYTDLRDSECDIDTHQFSFRVECGLSDLAWQISETTNANVELDF